jgi:hypothetical protein
LIQERENEQAFYLLKILCGPNIPSYLLRGIGIQKYPLKEFPSIVKPRDTMIEEYK